MATSSSRFQSRRTVVGSTDLGRPIIVQPSGKKKRGKVEDSVANTPSQTPGLKLSQDQGLQPAVKRTILELRSDAMATEPGSLIGAEEELIRRYGVSRPTLRQAAGLVAQEQLVRVRRGVGGGYFAERPTFTAVAHMAAVFLQTRQTTLAEILHAIEPIRVELVKLAAEHSDPELASRWHELLDETQAVESAANPYRAFLRSERHFGELLGEASRNNVLNLFLQTLLELVATSVTRDQDLFIGRPERVAESTARRIKIIRAIIEGDPEVAVLEAQRGARASTDWLIEDLAGGAPVSGASRDANLESERSR